MDKLYDVELFLVDGKNIKVAEMLDVGSYYYIAQHNDIVDIKKSIVSKVTYRTRKQCNDGSDYVKK